MDNTGSPKPRGFLFRPIFSLTKLPDPRKQFLGHGLSKKRRGPEHSSSRIRHKLNPGPDEREQHRNARESAAGTRRDVGGKGSSGAVNMVLNRSLEEHRAVRNPGVCDYVSFLAQTVSLLRPGDRWVPSRHYVPISASAPTHGTVILRRHTRQDAETPAASETERSFAEFLLILLASLISGREYGWMARCTVAAMPLDASKQFLTENHFKKMYPGNSGSSRNSVFSKSHDQYMQL